MKPAAQLKGQKDPYASTEVESGQQKQGHAITELEGGPAYPDALNKDLWFPITWPGFWKTLG